MGDRDVEQWMAEQYALAETMEGKGDWLVQVFDRLNHYRTLYEQTKRESECQAEIIDQLIAINFKLLEIPEERWQTLKEWV